MLKKLGLTFCVLLGSCGCSKNEFAVEPKPSIEADQARQSRDTRELSHDETLAWIHEHRAWRQAVKTKPIWARAVTSQEVGKKFQTADRAIEEAREGIWLCVGVANEPWFQKLDKIESKYDSRVKETKQFAFDDIPHEYQLFHPKGEVVNWAACVQGPGIAGFSIRPGYDPSTLLYSPAGGYVVTGDVADPYRDNLKDIWLVQKSLFESTYEFLPDSSDSQTKLETGDSR